MSAHEPVESAAPPPDAAELARPSAAPVRRRRAPWPLLVTAGLLGATLVALPLVRRAYPPLPTAPASPPALPVLVELPDYTFTSEQGRAFGSAELRGKLYVANFVFTSCPTVCPRLTRKMVALQSEVARFGGDVHLVTFSVDPENDTPERLREYGVEYGADFERWSFLTGPLETIEQVVVDGFKIALGKTELEGGAFEIFHGERLVLVDRAGKVRGYYEASDEGRGKLLRDLDRLAAAPR